MQGDVAVNDAEAHLQSALAGMGIIQAARFLVLPYLQSGRLREILPQYAVPSTAISMVYPTSRHLSSTVRAFVDWAATLLGNSPLLATESSFRRLYVEDSHALAA
jgi:LysR family transcriptional regulator, regulator for bpeEF and oprC